MMTDVEQAQGTALPGAAAESGRTGLLLPVILSATFMQFVDDSIVNVAIPSLQSGLRASSAAVELVVSVYLLAFSMTLITGARLGDIYGRRRLFLTGMAGFTIASAACGAAPSATVLIVARIFQGMFSGLMFPQVMSVIQVTFGPRERGRVFGIVGAVIALATVLGPLAGGVFVALNVAGLSWRLIFLVNVPIGVAALAGAARLLPESRAVDAPRLDLPGAALATAGVGLLVYPLVEGREQQWPLPLDILLGASVPVLAAFLLLQRRSPARGGHPLIRWSLLRQRPFVAGSLLSLVFYLGVVPFFFVFNIYLQKGLGFSALASGLTVLPIALGAAAASWGSAEVARRLGNKVLSLGAWLMGAGMAFVVVTIHWAGSTLSGYDLLPSFVLTGIGLGLVVGPLTNLVLAEVRPADVGGASGVLGTVQQLGGAVGVALIGVLFFGPLGGQAGRTGFSRPIQQALGYEIAICLVSGLLVLALPRTRAAADLPGRRDG
jgi:EmrB/QacA subfamily drug resistance transporter